MEQVKWMHSFLQCALHFAHREVVLHTFGEPHYIGEHATKAFAMSEMSVATDDSRVTSTRYIDFYVEVKKNQNLEKFIMAKDMG